ncbi:MAG: hypothetical protein ACLVEX_17650 [Ruthenibacterium lactatiformans]
MARKPAAYTNESITSLKGADRVRKRPGVIFGSDGVDGCAHSIFEILSNAIDEAREGYGNRILITKFKDGSVEVEDFGRGMPVDYNKNEQRYNCRSLLFCEMYAGGKYHDNGGGQLRLRPRPQRPRPAAPRSMPPNGWTADIRYRRLPLSRCISRTGENVGRPAEGACHPQKDTGPAHPLEAGRSKVFTDIDGARPNTTRTSIQPPADRPSAGVHSRLHRRGVAEENESDRVLLRKRHRGPCATQRPTVKA